MQSTARIALSVFLLSSALATAYHKGEKLRRDGVLAMYPFPRVGRASSRTWQVPIHDFDLGDIEPLEKRQLYAFPRVGRGEGSLGNLFHADQLQSLRMRRADSPGMWFGPRLGRAVKNDDNGNLIRDHLRDVSSENNNNYGMWFGPRVGRSPRIEENDMVQNETNERSEPEQMEPSPVERKKRQAKPL